MCSRLCTVSAWKLHFGSCTQVHDHSLNDTDAASSPHNPTWMIQSGVRPIRCEHVPSPWLESWKCCTCEHMQCAREVAPWHTARDSMACLTIQQQITLTSLGHEQLGQTQFEPSTRSATASAGCVRHRVWNARSQLRHCSGAPTCKDFAMCHASYTAHLLNGAARAHCRRGQVDPGMQRRAVFRIE